MVWETFNCVYYADMQSFVGIDPKTSVVERSVSNVSTVNTPERPASSNTRFLTYDNFGAWWGKWCGVKIERTMNLCMCGEFGFILDPRKRLSDNML